MPAAATRAPSYGRFVVLIVKREVVSKLTSPWFFVVASCVCLIAFAYGSGFQNTFETESVLVTTDPLAALNIMVVIFLGLVLGLRLATSLSWEREHRTLEVLLVGPVPWSVVVLSKFVVEFLVFAAILLIYWAYLFIGQPLGAGVVGENEVPSLLNAPLFALPVMALGLLVSAWAASVRVAVVAYFVVVGLTAAYEAALGALRGTPPEEASLTGLYLRAGLEAVAPVLRPISPASHLAMMIERLFSEIPATTMQVSSVLLTLGLLVLSLFVAKARGAQG